MIGLMGRSQGSSALSSNEKKKITDSGQKQQQPKLKMKGGMTTIMH